MLFSFPEHFVQKCVPAISALMALGLPGILSEFREIAYNTRPEEKRCRGGFGETFSTSPVCFPTSI